MNYLKERVLFCQHKQDNLETFITYSDRIFMTVKAPHP